MKTFGYGRNYEIKLFNVCLWVRRCLIRDCEAAGFVSSFMQGVPQGGD